jgi:hypothetical protein
MDFLKNWVARIDCDEPRLKLLEPGTASGYDWGESLPITYDGKGIPQVLAAAGKFPHVSFSIATGGRGTGSLTDWVFSNLGGSGGLQVTGNQRITTVAGDRAVQVGRLSNLSLGPFRHGNLRFISGADNKLGLTYLRRYRVTLDFFNNRIYLAKGKRFADPDHGQMSGMHYLFKPSGIELDAIDPVSPAGVAGLHAKDVLLSLNGTPVSELKPAAIRRLLDEEGKPLRVTVKRDGTTMEFSLTPKEYD